MANNNCINKSYQLTQDRLREILHYDPVTGAFTRLTRVAKRTNIGDVAGHVSSKGYVLIKIKGKSYSAHRLAWLYMTGVWPKTCVMHDDGNTQNNCFSNLRNTPKEIKYIELSRNRLIDNLDYNPNTGIFTWKVSKKGRRVGDIAGCEDKYGYIRIRIDDELYLAHRLAWLFAYGKWPDGDIDHIDGITSNNKINNLRDVSKSGNAQNRKMAPKSNKSTGILGVSLHRASGKFRATIFVGRKSKHLGCFSTVVEAYEIYLKNKRLLHECNTL